MERVWWVAGPIEQWYGRKKELDEVKTILGKDHLVSIIGSEGIGKTQLAICYANHYKDVYANAIFLNASSIESVKQKFQELSENWNVDSGNPDDIFKHLMGGTLFIFDDVADFEILAPYVPSPAHADVIITSRSQNWQSHQVILLGALSEEDSFKLICDVCKTISTRIVNRLCELLNYLPVALDQARSYIKNELNFRTDAEDVVEDIIDKIESGGMGRAADPSITVHYTVSAIIESIKKREPENSKAALHILYVASFFPLSVDVPVKYFVKSECCKSAVDVLVKYSLITIATENCRSAIKIHSTTQTAVRLMLIGSNEYSRYIIKALKILNKPDMEMRHQKMIVREYLDHCNVAMKFGSFDEEEKIFLLNVLSEHGDDCDKLQALIRTVPPELVAKTKVARNSIKSRCFGVLDTLIEMGYNRSKLLFSAVKCDDLEVIEFLFGRGANAHEMDGNGCSLMHVNAMNGSAVVTKYLHEQAGLSVNRYNYEGKTPLYYATDARRTDVAQYLAENGAILLYVNEEKGSTPLHICATNGQLDLVEYFSRTRSLIDHPDYGGNSALYHSIVHDHTEVARRLIESGADIGHVDGDGQTLLHTSVVHNLHDLVAYFLEKQLPIDKKDEFGSTVLDYSIKNKNLVVAKLLVEYGADTSNINVYEYTALHQCVCSGSTELLEYFLGRNLPVNARDSSGRTALFYAVEMCKECVELLVENGADVAVEDNDGRTLLPICAMRGDLKLTRYLIERGLSVDQKDKYGVPALFSAVYYDRLDIVDCLIENGADTTATNEQGWSLLHECATAGNLPIAKLCLSKGVPVDLKNCDGDTPLYCALHHSNLEVADHLIEHGAPLNCLDGHDRNLLHLSAEHGYFNFAKYALEHGLPVDETDDGDQTALMYAVDNRQSEVVHLLVQAGADLHRTDDRGCNLVHYAARRGDREFIEYLLNHNVAADEADGDGSTPLMHAASNGEQEIAMLLIERGGANPLATNASGRTLLDVALQNYSVELVHYLVEHGGVDVNHKDDQGNSALFYAIDYCDLVHYLVDKGADASDCNAKKRTLLHLGAIEGFVDIVEFHVERGWPLDVRDADGNTALYHAVSGHNVDIARFLMERGADASRIDADGSTPLHVAAARGLFDFVRHVVEGGGVDVDARDNSGRTALHYAIKESRSNIARYLMDRGASADDVAGTGASPLRASVEAGNVPMTVHFLRLGWPIDELDADGNGLLHSGCRALSEGVNRTSAVPYLVSLGADVRATNRDLETPLHCCFTESSNEYIVIGREFYRIVQLLVERGASAGARDSRGDTVLARAFRYLKGAWFGTHLRDTAEFLRGLPIDKDAEEVRLYDDYRKKHSYGYEEQ